MSQGTESPAGPRFEAVIGLEVHAQLLTRSKAFSPEPAAFGAAPNTYVDAISLAHPGTLPVFNEQVLAYTLLVGLATHCRVRGRSTFARKHYFYPDLPKGYQISQYEDPICHGGYVEIELEGDDGAPPTRRRIGLTRIHIEEDAGKSIHDQDPFNTLIDLNRCGTPLIEIVSEPELRSPREAYLYLTRLRQIVRYLGVCDGNMEEGSFRCDANVSVRPAGQEAFGTKTELKNMNSFRNVERALEYEIRRQVEVVSSGGVVEQETRLWDVGRQETRTMRTKESAHDYRYFPDPDLVPLVVTDAMLEEARLNLPELPEARARRFAEALGLPEYDAGVLTEERDVADYFEAALDALDAFAGDGGDDEDLFARAKAVSNTVMTDVLRVLNERAIPITDFPVAPGRLAGIVRMRLDGDVSSTGAQEIFEVMLDEEGSARQIAEGRNLLQVSDAGALLPVVEDVVGRHPKQVGQYLAGKHGLIGFFIGQVMRAFPGSPDPKLVRRLLTEAIESHRGTG